MEDYLLNILGKTVNDPSRSRLGSSVILARERIPAKLKERKALRG
jgi:hypothetical protein